MQTIKFFAASILLIFVLNQVSAYADGGAPPPKRCPDAPTPRCMHSPN